MKTKAFKSALPHTIPICIGFLFLGMSYGFLMRSKGFSFVFPMFMSLFIFAGSMEFVTVGLLLSAFHPLHAFFLALMVNARHLFYGISMLEKYKNTGWKKPYLIYGMCDESFTTMGALLGYVIHFDTTGIEFVMTALFVVMFINQWEESKDHRPALTGLGCSLLCLLVFGSQSFILPAMALIILCFSIGRRYHKKEETP